jgi:putative pyruvate formate lyase activating enzyme
MSAIQQSRQQDSRFILEDFEPAYMGLYRQGQLAVRAKAALAELEDCCACPRNCHVNRLNNEMRVCKTGRYAIVSSAFPHFGEEGCLSGWSGSGTIFFSLCNLRCVYCQNWDISQRNKGKECSADVIAGLALNLQAQGCHNINFVTPEHVAPQVIEAIATAVPNGLRLPIVYNTSAYDAVSTLRLLDGLVDIYMPDFKFWYKESARRLVKAKDYPQRAREAILEMHRQVGPLKFGPDGVARRGILLRHLVMPGQEREAAAIFQWLAEEISADTYVNVMGQYRPTYQVGESKRDGTLKYSDIQRTSFPDEIKQACTAARQAGLWRFAVH